MQEGEFDRETALVKGYMRFHGRGEIKEDWGKYAHSLGK